MTEHEIDGIHGHRETTGLPPLIGRPKQVAWAEIIRHRILAEVKKFLVAAVVTNSTEAAFWLNKEVIESDVKQGIQTICSQTSAEWWIEHRHLTGALATALVVDTINAVALIRRSNAKISAN